MICSGQRKPEYHLLLAKAQLKRSSKRSYLIGWRDMVQLTSMLIML
jgi:hypothetical protein